MDRQGLDELKRRIALVDYLKCQNWKPCRQSADQQVGGLCPLHPDNRPSFWIHTIKNVFYCHGCGRGGDLIRFVELFQGLPFPAAVAHLRRWAGQAQLLADTAAFYQFQLHRHPEAIQYLAQRGLHDPALLGWMGVGYAPGACLRSHLSGLGYGNEQMRQAGLISASGWDTFYRRVVFPCRDNLYGRSIGAAAPHRFLAGGKGGLYGWAQLRQDQTVILVEGIFDVAALWQAGFHNATCGWGAQLNRAQWAQLCAGTRAIWIVFDGDRAGQQSSQRLALRLRQTGHDAFLVGMPEGHDPASYFAAGASAADFQTLLERAQR